MDASASKRNSSIGHGCPRWTARHVTLNGAQYADADIPFRLPIAAAADHKLAESGRTNVGVESQSQL